MHLKSLYIQGFKSFANKTILKFDKGVTSVVGPNGSGKSNIADAMRWVLGNQSLKTIRSKKSEDVIFAGSKSKPKMGMAEVSMVFDNSDNKMAIDYPEVTITRRMFRSGENEYYINKTQTRLKDVIELLAKSNVGQRSYSIVGQGMIDRLLYMSARERKEMFDDAAGVKQYQLKKEAAERDLENTKENLKHIADLTKELKPHLKSLEQQAERAKRREEIEKSLFEKQIVVYSSKWNIVSDRISILEKQFNEQSEKSQNKEKELGLLRNEISKIEEQNSKTTIKDTSLETEYQEMLRKISELEREKAIASAKLEMKEGQILGFDISALRSSKASKETELSSLKSRIEESEKTLVIWKAEAKNKLETSQKIDARIKKAQTLESSSPSIKLEKVSKEIKEIAVSQKSLLAKIELAKTIEDIKEIKTIASKISSITDNLVAEISLKSEEPKTDELNRLFIEKQRLSDETQKAINEISKNEAVAIVLREQKAKYEEEITKINNQIKEHGSVSEKDTDTTLSQKVSTLEKQIKEFETAIHEIKSKLDAQNQQEIEKNSKLLEYERKYRSMQDELSFIKAEISKIEIKMAEVNTRKSDLENRIKEETGEREESIKKDRQRIIPEGSELEKLEKEMYALKHQYDSIGQIEGSVVGEYKEVQTRYEFLIKETDDLKEASGKLRKIIKELEDKIKVEFEKAFKKINTEFTKFFKVLFGGGDAKLELKTIEPDQTNTHKKPVTVIDILAVPPGKKLKGLSMLSGGEKALTAIALISAIIENNPSPFVVLDEADAALDEANSRRYAKIIRSLSKNTQFITITHNRETMSESGVLYGVTMESNGVSRILSVRLEEAEKIAQ